MARDAQDPYNETEFQKSPHGAMNIGVMFFRHQPAVVELVDVRNSTLRPPFLLHLLAQSCAGDKHVQNVATRGFEPFGLPCRLQEWVTTLENDDSQWDQNVFNRLARSGILPKEGMSSRAFSVYNGKTTLGAIKHSLSHLYFCSPRSACLQSNSPYSSP